MQITNIPDPRSPTGGQTDFTLLQGETVATPLTITSSGVAINLTSYTGRLQIAAPTGYSTILLTTENSGLVITSGVNGTIQINIASSVTEAMSPGTHSYDLFLKSPAGVDRAYLSGKFRILAAETPTS